MWELKPGDKRFVKTSTILQMEHVECGAAALAIILDYHGKYRSLEELRLACKVSRDGTKASHMVQAARSYNLQAQGAQVLNLEDLQEIKPPFIAFWEFNHFVVVEGIKRGKVFINDPARGRYNLSFETFGNSYTGVILMFVPSEDFQRDKRRLNLWRPYFKDLQGSVDAITFVTLLSLFLIIPGVLVPGFSKIFIDDILVKGYANWVQALLWGIVATALVRALLTWMQQTYLMKLHLKLTMVSTSGFMKQLLQLPLRFFQQRYSGDILERVAANERIATFFSNELMGDLLSLLSVLFFGLILTLLSWPLFIVAFLILLINGIVVRIWGPKLRDISHLMMRDMAKLSSVEVNNLAVMETVKACGLESSSFKLWAGQQADVISNQQNLQLKSRHFITIPGLLGMISTIAMISVGALLIISGQLTVGTLVAFQSLFASFQGPFMNLLKFFERFQRIQADLNRQQDVHKHPVDLIAVASISEDRRDAEVHKLSGHLQVRDLMFSYSEEGQTLENISFTLLPGQSIGIAGASGSGKSTLIKLLLGLYTPRSGQILWDGQPLENISPASFAASVGYTDISVSLFDGTVEENLRLFNPKAGFDELQKVLKDAEIYDFLTTRQGIHTTLLEGGSNFSVGQAQRLEIAKALARNPSILIFDEATSALDTITEQKILSHLRQMKRTFLIVSHRLSAVKECDHILVLDSGRLVSQGMHGTLIETCTTYQTLMTFEDEDER